MLHPARLRGVHRLHYADAGCVGAHYSFRTTSFNGLFFAKAKSSTVGRCDCNDDLRGSPTVAAKGGVNEIADRYAKALFDLAEDGKQLDTVASDLRSLEAVIDESDDMRRMVRSPVISRADQSAAMGAVTDKLKSSDLTKKFIGYLAANRRLFALKAIIKAFLAELAASRGEVTAEVASAKPLSDAQIAAVEEALKKAVNGEVAVSHKVDPSLIGGLIVKVGSRMVDTSVATQLQRLKLAMKGA